MTYIPRANYAIRFASDQQMAKVNSLAKALGKAHIPGPLTRHEANRLINLLCATMDMKAVAEQRAKAARGKDLRTG